MGMHLDVQRRRSVVRPAAIDDGDWRALVLPPQRIRCHPHVVIANGLDLSHYETLHGMRFSRPPRLTSDRPFEVRVDMRGRPHSHAWRMVSGTTRTDLVAQFTTIGGSLAWSSVLAPIQLTSSSRAAPIARAGA